MTHHKTHYRRETCILCEGKNLALVLPLASSPIGNDYFPRLQEQAYFSLRLFLCQDCGNVQIEDVVNPELLFRSYTYSTSSSLGLVEHFRKMAQNMLAWTKTPQGSLVVDIGSNDGSLLQAFREQGMRVLGVDPAVSIAQLATAQGLETLPDFFSSRLAKKILANHGKASLITANNVFAHSDQLPDMADGICELLAKDGVFSFEVSYLLDILQKMLFDTVYHEHLCYHSVRSLSRFFQRKGLELFHMERIPTKGGSLRGSVQLAGGPRSKSSAIDRLLELEENVGLHNPKTYQAYHERILQQKKGVQELLQKIRQRGQKIAGYGASPTVTTLLHQFELADHLSFLVDDNPVKQNTYSPGQHLRVYNSDSLYQEPVDHVVILAWNYAQPIMKKHQAFLDRGGNFIIPLPLLQVA